jgi:cell division protein FtsZ
MSDDIMNFDLPVERSSIIKVLGIGGGGNNAVNHMFEKGITDVNFVICNTDHQALLKSQVPIKVQIGESLTEGRGAGSKPEIGRQAAIENINDVMDALSGNTKMVFHYNRNGRRYRYRSYAGNSKGLQRSRFAYHSSCYNSF